MGYNESSAYKLEYDVQKAEKAVKVSSKKSKKQLKIARRNRILFVCFLSALAFFVLSREVQIVDGNRKIAQLERELKSTESQTYQYMYEMERSTDIKKVEEIATTRLNMVKADKSQIVNLNIPQKDSVETVAKNIGLTNRLTNAFGGIFKNIAGIFATN